jgi:hypothetical protein
MNNKISHTKWMQMHRTDGTGAGKSTLYMSTLYVPLTPSISSWLYKKVHLTIWQAHKQNEFSSQINIEQQNISY